MPPPLESLRVWRQGTPAVSPTVMVMELLYASLLIAVALGIAWAAGYMAYTLYRRP